MKVKLVVSPTMDWYNIVEWVTLIVCLVEILNYLQTQVRLLYICHSIQH